MGTIFYFVKEAFRGLFAAKLMTFVSIITIGTSLFFMSLIGLGILNINDLLKNTQKKADVAVFLKDDFSSDPANVKTLMSQISSFPQVNRTEFLSKDSAMARFLKYSPSEMLDAVSGNPLPASIEIYVLEHYRSNALIHELQSKIQTLKGVESVRYSREWIDLVERFRNYFLVGSVVLVFIMLLVLHIMISNTIKLTIYARRELVKNMHLVGATRFFINAPFILEGMIQGILGSCVSTIALMILKLVCIQVPISWGPSSLTGIILLTGAFFGWIGSLSAIHKFMD
jgi:cell division transport system permease protein